ncbi:MAG: hypothetical protein LBH69_02095 [Methanomassiliicoccaceae archaeon]|nr:hypothetical protein [Methanomassiliicoccaceae archaeon]
MDIKSEAEKKSISLSSLVSEVLREHLEESWPDEFFESLGSIDDETFKVPEELPWSLDVPRDVL